MYPPSEDSHFLLSVVERRVEQNSRILEVGTGSGYIAVELAKQGFFVTATDVSLRALLNARLNARLNGVRIKLVLSDLFERVRGRFDVVVFNPPYLHPWEGLEDLTWDEDGTVVAFLEQVPEHLVEDGRFFLVLEENDVYRNVKKHLAPFCVKEYRNAFHLVVVEGYPCP